MQTSLPVVTVPAPSAPQLEDGAGCPLPAAFVKDPQPLGLRAAAALLQQSHIPLCAQKLGASSRTSGDVSKGNPAAAAVGCCESCLEYAIL